MLIPVLLAVVLVTLSASLTAVAAALTAVDRAELERRADAGDRRAAAVLAALERPDAEVGEIRMAVVLCTVGLGAVIEPLVDAGDAPLSTSMTDPSRAWSITLVLLLAFGAQIVVGEMVARSVGAQRPMATLMALGRPVRAIRAVLAPIAAAGAAVGRRLLGLLRADAPEVLSRIRSREDLRRMVRQSERSGTITATDADLFDRTLRFADKCAADAFTPRVEVESLSEAATVGDLIDRSAATGFSRFPVHAGDLDDIVGVVHVKDALGVPASQRRGHAVSSLLRPVHAVPESKDLETLMVELREAAGQFAVVVDEYGGTAGIITLEDLIEEIVGEISDEHDPALTSPTARRWAGAHLLSGALHADEVSDACEFRMPDGDYETLAGFVLAELGRVPEEGDRFQHDGWDLQVAAMDGNRVRTVKLVAPSPGAQDVVDPVGRDLR